MRRDWPQGPDGPALADLHLQRGRIARIVPHDAAAPVPAGTTWDLAGALVLPGLVDAHTHIDKTFTLPRMGTVQPGLLGAIEAMMADRVTWTPADVRHAPRAPCNGPSRPAPRTCAPTATGGSPTPSPWPGACCASWPVNGPAASRWSA